MQGRVEGPPDGYARRIRHTERVEYSYDPKTQQASARVVDSSEPVIVARDASPPDVQQRQVGAFDVVPEGRDVRATPREDAGLDVPPGILARLRAQAERDGGPVTRTETVSYEHDIDTQETDQRIEGGSKRGRALAAAGAFAGSARAAAGTVSGRAQALARQASTRARESLPETTAAIGERLRPTSQARSKESLDALVARLIRQAGQKPPPAKGTKRRGSSASKAKERRPSYQQPTIIVVREPGPGSGRRRYGGL